MRASRLLSILILLQIRGRMSAEALAEEFEVSVRTIYRDIDQLSAAGVPVYAERGRTGGFELMDGYRTRLTGFTAGEAEALLLSGVGRAAADLGLGSALADAEMKLLASLPPDAGASAQKVARRFHLDPVNWYQRAEAAGDLPAIAAAVWRETMLRIDYESWKGPVTRAVAPLGVVLKAGVWYLVAAVDGEPRTYRISNIRALESLDETFKRPAKFDLAKYWSKWACAFEAGLLRERAIVKLSPRGVRLLRDVSQAAADAMAQTGKPTKPVGWVRADIPIESIDHAAGQFLRLGADIEVIKPLSLREKIAAEAAKVARLYARAASSKKRP